MAGEAEFTLTNAAVNSGTAVKMNTHTCDYSWKNLTNVNSIAGAFDTAEVNSGGFENPVIVMRGVIDIEDTTSHIITHPLLMDFAQAKAATTLAVTTGIEQTVYLKGRPAAGYTVGGTYTNTLKVRIMDFTIKFNRTTEGGARWDYDMTLVETAE